MILLSYIVLLLAIALLPFSYLRLVANFSISDLFFSFSFLFILLYQFKINNSIKNILNDNIFLIPISIYSFGFFISYNSSISPLDSFFSFFQVIFIFTIIYYSFSLNNISYFFIVKILYLLALISSFVTFFIFIFYLTGIDYSGGLLFIKKGWGMTRFSYGAMEPNIAARIIAQNIPIILFFIFNSNKFIPKFFNILLLLLLLSIIILTASRTGFLIFSIGTICYLIFNFRLNRKYNIFKYLFYVGSFLFLTFYLYQTYTTFFDLALARYASILDYNVSASSKERLFVLDKSFDLINSSPIIGKGMGNSFNLTGVVVHNSLVVSWIENGFFGFIGFLSIYIILFYYILINYRNNFFNDKMLMILSVVTIMMILGDMFMASSYKRALWVPAIMFIVYSRQIIKIKLNGK